MVESLAAQTGGMDEYAQIFNYLVLSVERLERTRTKGPLKVTFRCRGRRILPDVEIIGLC